MICMRQSNSFPFEEVVSAKKAEVIGRFPHEILLFMIFLQTRPQVTSLRRNFYDLYFFVNKNVIDKDKEEKYEIADDVIQSFYTL